MLKHDEKELVLANRWATITEVNGKQWRTREPAIWVFKTGAWNNIICIFKNAGISYYVNIASPFIVEEGAVKYIDYDLDIKVKPDGAFELLDREEFQRSIVEFKYPEPTQQRIWAEIKTVKELIAQKDGIFSRKEVQRYHHLIP